MARGRWSAIALGGIIHEQPQQGIHEFVEGHLQFREKKLGTITAIYPVHTSMPQGWKLLELTYRVPGGEDDHNYGNFVKAQLRAVNSSNGEDVIIAGVTSQSSSSFTDIHTIESARFEDHPQFDSFFYYIKVIMNRVSKIPDESKLREIASTLYAPTPSIPIPPPSPEETVISALAMFAATLGLNVLTPSPEFFGVALTVPATG